MRQTSVARPVFYIVHDLLKGGHGWAKDGALYSYYGYAVFKEMRGRLITHPIVQGKNFSNHSYSSPVESQQVTG